MDFNSVEKMNVKNVSAPIPFIRTVDELNPGNKLITKLNHDCLAKVLMHLPVLDKLEMEKVCQKWNEATDWSWYNVKKLDFNDVMITLDKKEEIMKLIVMRCGRFLTHLKITEDHQIYPWMCDDVLKNNCQNIIHLDINISTSNDNGYEIPDEDFLQIITSMKKLKYLKVSMNTRSCYDLCNKMVDILPSDMNEIHLITVFIWPDEFERFAPVLGKFNNLHCMTLNGFQLKMATLESLLQSKNTLSKLNLSYCEFPWRGSSRISHFKNLELLHLYNVDNFDENEIVSIARNCSKLKCFEFTHSWSFGPKHVPYLVFRELKYLNLEHLLVYDIDEPDDGGRNQISEIASNWKELKYLNVNGGWNFSQLDFQEIMKFKNLQYLNLRNAEIDSQAFINIVSNCLELKELSMQFRYLSESDLDKLTNLKKLENLNFTICKNLTGNSLSNIVNNCQNLVDLDLRYCDNVTEDSLIQVGKLKYLKKLYMDKIENVPNAMFDDFCNLEDLSCRDCPSVADEGIIKVLDNCVKLSRLEVRGTGITMESLVHASKRKLVFKSLKIFADLSVKNNYTEIISTPTPYLTIDG